MTVKGPICTSELELHKITWKWNSCLKRTPTFRHWKWKSYIKQMVNETNLILQALKIEIMWNKSYPPSLGPNYEGIKISITIKLTKADIEAKSSTDIAKSQNPIVWSVIKRSFWFEQIKSEWIHLPFQEWINMYLCTTNYQGQLLFKWDRWFHLQKPLSLGAFLWVEFAKFVEIC